MARTFQNIRLFRDLPVIDNVMVGLHMRHGAGFVPTVLRIPAAARLAEADDPRPGARKCSTSSAWRTVPRELVGGSSLWRSAQGRVRARARDRAALLLLDEPTAGMNPQRDRRARRPPSGGCMPSSGSPSLLVEHDMRMVMSLCQRILVMQSGPHPCRGRAGADPARPARHRGLSRPRAARVSMLRLEDVHVRRGGTHALRGVEPRSRARRDRRADRRQRRRQDDHARRHLRPAALPAAGAIRFAPDAERNALDLVAACAPSGSSPPASRIVRRAGRSSAICRYAENLHGRRLSARRSGRRSSRTDARDRTGSFRSLQGRAALPGDRLSGGEQMMLAIGRALMSRPKLLLLDEPSLGLAPRLVEQIFDILRAHPR